MYCGKCGNRIQNGWDYCMNCGYRKKQEETPSGERSVIANRVPVDRAAQAMINADDVDRRVPERKSAESSPRRRMRAATVAFNASQSAGDERTRVYIKDKSPALERVERSADDERNQTYDDGYTDYYHNDVIRERTKQPIAAYIVSVIGLFDFVLIFLAYNGVKLFDSKIVLKDYGLAFLGAGAVIMLLSFILYSFHRSRYGLNFAGATGMIVSIGAFIVMLALLCLGAYTWLSTTKFLDLPKLPADIDIFPRF